MVFGINKYYGRSFCFVRSLRNVLIWSSSNPTWLVAVNWAPRLLYRRHRWKLFHLLVSMLLLRGLSVCHVHALCSNGWRYQHVNMMSFAYKSPMSHRVKIWLTSFVPKWSIPVNVSLGDIRWQTEAEWLEIAQWSQWRAYGKPPLFWMVLSLTPTISPFPK